ncbi:hypothetical protein QBC46DRAFT_354107 [Diplogelasinospora grovesii]|uniref:Uncharacterized protein n=1 Tax=Diplogelasinospora grovesii TaxID=303347 RepID=A0AAN6N8R9_9PEZI|nr:hypothetical protein QBC46DRAFT_354107 [Diplogelasinospora grovesii]
MAAVYKKAHPDISEYATQACVTAHSLLLGTTYYYYHYIFEIDSKLAHICSYDFCSPYIFQALFVVEEVPRQPGSPWAVWVVRVTVT